MSSEEMRRKVEAAMDKLASSLPVEPKRKPVPLEDQYSQFVGDRGTTVSRHMGEGYTPRKGHVLSPHKSTEGLQPEHKALIGKYATVDLPDGAGEARLRIYTVTVRRDGRVRAELRPPEGFTVYRTPDELRNVSDSQEG